MRFKSLQNNRIVRYLSYALGEIILIVLGILIALQINNKNEAKKIEAKRQNYYKQLLDDFNTDKIINQKCIKKYNEEREAFISYKQSFETQQQSLENALLALKKLNQKHYVVVYMSHSTIESVSASGDLTLFPPNLRKELVALKRRQKQMISGSSESHNSKNFVFNKALLLMGSYEFQDRIKDNPKLKSFLNNPEKLEETILALEAIQLWREIEQNQTLIEVERIEKQMDNIIALINNELTNKPAPQSPLIQNP